MATRLEWIPKLCKSQLGVKLTQGCILKMLCLSIRAKRSMSISRLLFSKSTAWKIGGTCVSNNLVIPLTTLCATFIVLIHHVHHHHHHHHYHHIALNCCVRRCGHDNHCFAIIITILVIIRYLMGLPWSCPCSCIFILVIIGSSLSKLLSPCS